MHNEDILLYIHFYTPPYKITSGHVFKLSYLTQALLKIMSPKGLICTYNYLCIYVCTYVCTLYPTNITMKNHIKSKIHISFKL